MSGLQGHVISIIHTTLGTRQPNTDEILRISLYLGASLPAGWESTEGMGAPELRVSRYEIREVMERPYSLLPVTNWIEGIFSS